MLYNRVKTVQDMARATQSYLGTLMRLDTSIQSSVVYRPGYRTIRLLDFTLTPDNVPALRDVISEWIRSEEGSWVISNLSNIRVDGVYDAASDLDKFRISSMLSDQEAVEYSLRWL